MAGAGAREGFCLAMPRMRPLLSGALALTGQEPVFPGQGSKAAKLTFERRRQSETFEQIWICESRQRCNCITFDSDDQYRVLLVGAVATIAIIDGKRWLPVCANRHKPETIETATSRSSCKE